MNIIVCLKQVMDPDVPPIGLKIDTNSNRVVQLIGQPPILDPYSEHALEAALRIKDARGGKVTALSLGTDLLSYIVKMPLSIGADELILLEDEAFADGDSWSTAYALAMALKNIGSYDLDNALEQLARGGVFHRLINGDYLNTTLSEQRFVDYGVFPVSGESG